MLQPLRTPGLTAEEAAPRRAAPYGNNACTCTDTRTTSRQRPGKPGARSARAAPQLGRAVGATGRAVGSCSPRSWHQVLRSVPYAV